MAKKQEAVRSIIIKLDKDPRDANEFSNPLDVIQQDALRKFETLLKRNVENIGRDSREESGIDTRQKRPRRVRRHDVISLHGERGSGKTTFILNALAAAEHSEEFCDKIGVQTGEIVSLGLIDPTLIETKENIIVTLLGRIKNKVDCHRNRPRGFSSGDDEYKDYRAWEDSLRNLAEGLSLLDGIGKDNAYGEDWHDPQYILDRGLSHAASGTDFEENFRRFVAKSLKYLDKKAFILAFDDIDTNFEKGWPVLETIRKYLTTPQLIVILSGDMDLYSMLVRRNQWSMFGNALLDTEKWLSLNGRHLPASAALSVNARMGSIVSMVDKLEGQYLLKVLKPENRIDLAPLRRYTSADSERIQIERAGGERTTLTKALEILATNALAMRSPSEQALFRDVILRQPIRTVIQLLYSARSSIADTANASTDAGDTDLQDAFRNTFVTNLLARGLSPDDIRDTDAFRLILVLADWLTNGDGWALEYRLRPEHRDDNLNLAITALSAALVQEFARTPGAMADYLIKIARPHEWILRNTTEKTEISSYVDFIGVSTGEKVTNVARRSIAWERSFKFRQMDQRLGDGIAAVPVYRIENYDSAIKELYGLKYGAGGSKDFREFSEYKVDEIGDALNGAIKPYFNSIFKEHGTESSHMYLHYAINTMRTISSNVRGAASIAARIPFTWTEDNFKRRYGYYSIDPLISTIGEILSIPTEHEEEIEKHIEEQVKNIINEHKSSVTYPVPARAAFTLDYGTASSSSDENANADDEGDTGHEEAEADADKQVESLVKTLVKWRLKYVEKKITPESPATLARAWKRYASATSSVEEELKHLDTRYLGVLMHRYCVLFLNSLLVESALAHRGGGDMALPNPVTSSKFFMANLNEKSRLPENSLFHAVYSCPLWAFFLAPESYSANVRFQEGEVLKDQIARWREFAPDKDAEQVILTKYTPRGSRSAPTVEFVNLFDPLNSVYIQRPPEQGKLRPLAVRRAVTTRNKRTPTAGEAPDGAG